MAKIIGAPLADAARLLSTLPVVLPIALADDVALRSERTLAALGLVVVSSVAGEATACGSHRAYFASGVCAKCEAPICSLCWSASPAKLCSTCERKSQRSRSFYLVRVSVLLAVLGVVSLYAWRDARRRNERTDWNRTLDIALVIVRDPRVSDLDVEALTLRLPALEARLSEEMHRYRAEPPRPFAFTVLGPAPLVASPPVPDTSGGAVSSVIAGLRYTLARSRYLAPIDEAVGIRSRKFDARVYLMLRPSTRDRNFVEGLSELGGRVGVVQVEMDKGMVDFALFVATHEIFHTLGATDRYAPDGAILLPEGLGDPEASPLYPQRHAELMARLRAISPTSGVSPESLDELKVGPITAREIGWLK